MTRKTTPGDRRIARHQRVRRKVEGSAQRPRLSVFRSLTHIHAQIIDDQAMHTLVAASSRDIQLHPQRDGKSKTEVARMVGALLGQRAKAQGISNIVFDRGGFLYHGRVKALAEAARKEGLSF